MTLRKLPKIEALQAPTGTEWDAPIEALDRWHNVQAAENDDRTINIYEQIGERWDGSGMTANRVRGLLRKMGKGGVTVNLNSPGGDFFDGIAIYNILREHEGEVKVNVVGLAASAASVIAMAADELRVARAGFLMIHNSWAVSVGNRNDMRETADVLERFDASMSAVYSARTGKPKDEIAELMDKEEWMSGEDAVERGFADALLASDEVDEKDEDDKKKALRALESALMKDGKTRSERREILSKTFGKPGATEQADKADTKPCAGNDELVKAIKAAMAELN